MNSELRARHERTIEVLQATIEKSILAENEVQAMRDTLQEEREATASRVQQLQRELKESRLRIHALEGERDQLEARATQATTPQSTDPPKVLVDEEEVRGVKQELATAQQTVAAGEARAEELRRERDDALEKVRLLQARLDDSLDAGRSQEASWASEREGLLEAQERLRRELTEKERDIGHRTSTIEQLRSTVRDLRRRLEEEEAMTSLESERSPFADYVQLKEENLQLREKLRLAERRYLSRHHGGKSHGSVAPQPPGRGGGTQPRLLRGSPRRESSRAVAVSGQLVMRSGSSSFGKGERPPPGAGDTRMPTSLERALGTQ